MTPFTTFFSKSLLIPERFVKGGATNALNIIKADTGLPGKPITNFSSITPTIVGFPG